MAHQFTVVTNKPKVAKLGPGWRNKALLRYVLIVIVILIDIRILIYFYEIKHLFIKYRLVTEATTFGFAIG